MTVQVRTGTRTRAVLADGLRDRLPGLAVAMDEDFAVRQVQRLLRPDGRVDKVSVGSVWFSDDGTCSLRYRLLLTHRTRASDQHAVLARVHPDAAAATAYLEHTVRELPGVRGEARLPYPWRASTGLVPDAALALHRFPIDPALPTLARALDPVVVHRVLGTSSDARGPVTVEVVHYPREGSCVLRYQLADGAAGRLPAHKTTFYGKVYSDSHGEVVEGLLRTLVGALPGGREAPAARLPTPVAYVPSLHLLVTEALPGNPLVPRLLKDVLRPSQDPDTPDPAPELNGALRSAVRESARALAALHGVDLQAVDLPESTRVHSASAELASLRRDLDVISAVWPDVAERVRRRVGVLFEHSPDAPDAVLSHGDFTPAQALLGEGTCGLVDLDTTCRADPALDLGRFLAQLELRIAKLGGGAARPLADELTDDFLRAYHEETAPGAASADGRRPHDVAAGRVAFYRGASLARSALHACRQLKDERLATALSLLDPAHP